MQLSFAFGADGVLDSRLAAVFASARRTAAYGPLIATAEREGKLSLLGLPPVSIHTYLEDRDRFRNPKAAAAAPPPSEDLCGSVEELLRQAERSGRSATSAARVTVRTALGERFVSERARDCLWSVFELPLFEQLVGSECEVLASECEAHSGFHLRTEAAVFEVLYGELVVTSLEALCYPILRLRTGWVGAIEQGVCPCGERVTRFLPVVLAAMSARKPPRAALISRHSARHPAVASV